LVSQGQQDAAVPLIEQGLDLARRLREHHLTAGLLATRSTVAYVAGDEAARPAMSPSRCGSSVRPVTG